MARVRIAYGGMVVATAIAAAFWTAAASADVVCDKFDMKWKVSGNTLDLSLDTDLPDNTVLMVSVSRSYFEKGNTSEYSHDYFSEKSTAYKWSKTQKISIDPDKWKSSLREKKKDLSRIGLGFQVGSISEKISISMVVPINQPSSEFGENNSKLTGKAVHTKGLRVVEKEVEFQSPLDLKQEEEEPLPSLDPRALDIGATYVVSRNTPLMPSHSPADPLEALKEMKCIPEGGAFKVIEIYKKAANPWYKVTTLGKDKESLGTGWINSTALVGQELEASK